MNDIVSMDDRLQYVKSQAVFSGLAEKEFVELASLFIEKKYKPGDMVVQQGKPVDSVFLIVTGDADVRVAIFQDNQIKESSVAKLKDGNAIGLTETGFYSLSGMRTATVIATTDMVLLSLSVASFNGFALANSHVTEVMRKNASNMVEP